MIAIIEVLKNSNADFQLVEPKAVIEMILYVRYNLSLRGKNMMIGIITERWHCLKFIPHSTESIQLRVQKYSMFKVTEFEVMCIVPQTLKMFDQ